MSAKAAAIAAIAARQRALLAALGGSAADAGSVEGLAAPAGIEGGAGRGLRAYRLNARALSARTLAIAFPRLRQALGEDSFDLMAWAFWRRHPPQCGDLGLWGERLAGFLAAQSQIDVALCDLARLEWALHQAERAADAALDSASLSLLDTQAPTGLGLRLRPGLQLLRQSDGPLLVWRRGWRACSRALGAGDAAFIAALLDGQSLGAALEQAASTDAAFDFSAWLQTALRDAWLQAATSLDPDRGPDDEYLA